MINKVKLFDNITEQEKEQILSHLKTRHYKKNHILVFEDSPLDYIYIVKKGFLKIYRSYEGKELILGFASDDDILGEMELFSDNQAISSIEMLENSELYVVSKKEFENIVFENKTLLKTLLNIHNERVKQLNKRIRTLSFYSVNARLCHVLIHLIEDLDSPPYVIKKLNQSIFADIIGASRESVSKAFSELQKDHIVEYDTKKITILDLEKLRKYSDNII
ncbi:cAMP-activated global transcriptional regulator CRP [Halolactibacillus alkaliphilus]|uniref:Transcriptional regulator n=1 Tax=Halolactibacillus alkaliphilus TaxID=442899 RepID=A0A511X0J7_9BACI|nr:Crp/Fnr family transcriptional regulator [Halolactibacillus alkaliphilus]GEN56473.1 transcriptional regulator [Halolactibacillus alkaliphilus]GGN64275.1 cAMP-activated global transcriptional regulator CRP [Halolactibacillus alkaliphilus]SFO61479.1 CRP/FNR family transcriptional regulator, anaerobic regulatory protein [Halolactibacillus alkaliphilus]